MKKVFTLCILIAALSGFAQQTAPSLQEALAGKLNCGVVYQKSAADTVVIISGNCWGKPKAITDTIKKVDVNKGLTGKVSGLNRSDTGAVFSNVHIRCNPGRVLSSDNRPLLLVNLKIYPLETIGTLNPNIIQSVQILKSAEATAIFGPDGVNGAILVATKETTHWQVWIKDKADSSTINAATVKVKNRNTGKIECLIANDNGFVLIDKKIFGDSILSVSAIGYESSKAAKIELPNLGNTLFLSRDVKVCEEVLIKNGHGYGCRRKYSSCTLYCKIPGVVITLYDTISNKNPNVDKIHLMAYPNPANRNSLITLKAECDKVSVLALRVISANGNIIHTQKINNADRRNPVQVPTGNWPAGIYFIQLLYANGQPAASERIVIQ